MTITVGAGIQFGAGITVGATSPNIFWTWDPSYLGPVLALGNNNNSVFDTNIGYTSVLGTEELSAVGRVMYSVTLNYDYDIPHALQYLLGLGNHSTDLTTGLGSDVNSVGIGTDGNVYYAGTTAVTGLPTWGATGDVLDIAVNPGINGMWMRVNGGNWNNSPTADPATNAEAIEIFNGPYYPAVTVAGENGPSEFTVEPVAQYTVPAGYTFVAGTEGANLMLNLDAADYASAGSTGYSDVWIDISGHNNNAYFTNGSLVGGTISASDMDPASYFTFDGTGSSYADINYSTSMSPTGQISWLTWAFSNTTPSGDGDYHWILRNGWAGSPWYYGLNTNGKWELIINDTGYVTNAGPQLTAGWHQIVGTYDGTNVRMYLDGAYVATLTGSATGPITGYNPANPTIIGGGTSNTGSGVPTAQYWNGGISVIKMYDTQLSPSQILANYNATVGRYAPALDITASNLPSGNPTGSITFDITSDNGSTVLEAGVIFGLPGQTTYATSVDTCVSSSSTSERTAIRVDCGTPPTTGLTGSQTISFNAYMFDNETINIVAYARNAYGVAYSPTVLSWTPAICLAEGTQITLADGTTKAIEDIAMTDSLRVWDFDLGQPAEARPLWIKQTETTTQYNLLTFSDGTTLKTINQHRIFNKEAGAFTYPMTEATPVGTTTVNVAGEEVTLVDKCIIIDTVNYYNVITNHHLNLYADGILTSMRYNNIYPIVNMQFVKDSRRLRDVGEFAGIDNRWITGLRLAEQTMPLADIKQYVKRLEYRELVNNTKENTLCQ
jgi:hypothetical protein